MYIDLIIENEIQNYIALSSFNSLPDNKILDWSKLKAFAHNKINVT